MPKKTEQLSFKRTLEEIDDCEPAKKLKSIEKRSEIFITVSTEKTDEQNKISNLNIHPNVFNDMMPCNIKFAIKNGIRFLEPYWSAFGSYAKGRWVGRKVCEVFTTEFLSHNKYYPKAAIRMGRLFINGKQMTNPDYCFRTSDKIIHLGHRHEHPILAEPDIKVLVDNENWFVVNKPPSMPVHACGQYRVHSVIGLLRTMNNITGLKVCHRLDRTTSGVLVFARDHKSDLMFKDMLQKKQLSKKYISKVDGIFPDGEVVCSAPLGVLSVTMGIQCVRADGKEAFSKFRRISKNEAENTSLVLCQIETGRTHQIRVHLQYLGFPIVQDLLYNDIVWGPDKGKMGNYEKSLEELKTSIQAKHKSSLWFEEENSDYEDRLREIAENNTQLPNNINLQNLQLESLPKYDSICLGCNVTKRVPSLNHFQILLHCWRYESIHWQFEAPLPGWASLTNNELASISG